LADGCGSFDAANADARFYKNELIIPEELQELNNINPVNNQDHFFCISAEDFEIDKGFLKNVIWGPRKGEDGNFLCVMTGHSEFTLLLMSGQEAEILNTSITL